MTIIPIALYTINFGTNFYCYFN